MIEKPYSLKGKLTPSFHKFALEQLLNEVPADGTYQIEIKKYKKDRSGAQRRLQHVWYTQIREAGERQETKQQIENYCKYTFGVPILDRDNETFSLNWQRMADLLTYEQKIDAMEILEVTRLFNVKQNTEYLEEMKKHYQLAGLYLESGDDLYYEAMGYKR